jgi:hypothetical protein
VPHDRHFIKKCGLIWKRNSHEDFTRISQFFQFDSCKILKAKSPKGNLYVCLYNCNDQQQEAGVQRRAICPLVKYTIIANPCIHDYNHLVISINNEH